MLPRRRGARVWRSSIWVTSGQNRRACNTSQLISGPAVKHTGTNSILICMYGRRSTIHTRYSRTQYSRPAAPASAHWTVLF